MHVQKRKLKIPCCALANSLGEGERDAGHLCESDKARMGSGLSHGHDGQQPIYRQP